MTEWTNPPLDGRTVGERFADRALLLLAVNFAEKVGRIDNFRLMKIPFVVQHELNQNGIKSFSYRFYREEHGPISKAIYEDRDVFRDSGLIEGGSNSLRLSKLGDQLTRVIGDFLGQEKQNEPIIKVVEAKAQRYASLPTWEAIKAEVYGMEVEISGTRLPVGKVLARTDVLAKLPSASCKSQLAVPEPLMNTLALAFSLTPEDIEAGSRDSGLTIDQVFSAA